MENDPISIFPWLIYPTMICGKFHLTAAKKSENIPSNDIFSKFVFLKSSRFMVAHLGWAKLTWNLTSEGRQNCASTRLLICSAVPSNTQWKLHKLFVLIFEQQSSFQNSEISIFLKRALIINIHRPFIRTKISKIFTALTHPLLFVQFQGFRGMIDIFHCAWTC